MVNRWSIMLWCHLTLRHAALKTWLRVAVTMVLELLMVDNDTSSTRQLLISPETRLGIVIINGESKHTWPDLGPCHAMTHLHPFTTYFTIHHLAVSSHGCWLNATASTHGWLQASPPQCRACHLALGHAWPWRFTARRRFMAMPWGFQNSLAAEMVSSWRWWITWSKLLGSDMKSSDQPEPRIFEEISICACHRTCPLSKL